MSAVLEREQLVDPTEGLELTTGDGIALNAPRHIFLAADLLDPARKRDIRMVDGGEELPNPCLRRTAGKLHRCAITPMEFWGVQMPKELFPEGVQPLVLKGVQQPEGVSNPYVLQSKPLYFMPQYPGELIVDALGIASGERRGIVEIEVLRAVPYGPDTQRMQDLFFPADYVKPLELRLTRQHIEEVGSSYADPDVQAIAADMLRSCDEFKEYAEQRISLCHAQLDTRTTQWGHTYSYSPKVLALMAQLEMRPRNMGVMQLQDQVAQAVAGSGITPEQLEAIMARNSQMVAELTAKAITDALAIAAAAQPNAPVAPPGE